MKMNDNIFREYDIRGVVDGDFDAEFAKELGKAYAVLVKRETKKERPCLGIGFDCRLSRVALSEALIAGLTQAGVDVVNGGMGPTPQLYFTVFSRDLDGGIQITGSHNPGDQNGFKMMVGKCTLSGGDIQELKQIISSGCAPIADVPASVEEYDARSHYISDLIERSREHMGSRKLKVVVDSGNGVGGLVGPEVLRGLGCEVIELYSEPDGSFPNHHPDPTELENIVVLRETVVREKADLGIAWDGDADRIGVVDENGAPIFGDMLLTIYGRHLLKEVEKPIIIGDVKCSELMFEDLRSKGATTVMAKTGHSLIKAKLKELDAHLAGEMSGHVFFAHRFFGFDDALHASARLVEILSNTDSVMSSLLEDLPKVVSTPEIRMDCPEEVKFELVKKVQKAFDDYEHDTLDGIRVRFANGWGLARASNTQPILVLRFEAETEEQLSEYRSLMEGRIAELRSTMEIV